MHSTGSPQALAISLSDKYQTLTGSLHKISSAPDSVHTVINYGSVFPKYE